MTIVIDGTTGIDPLITSGNTTLGNASGDTLTINAATVSTPNGLNFDSNTLVIDATNNVVGIGTSSPSVPLDVVSDSSTQGIRIRGRSSDNAGSIRMYSNDNATQYAYLRADAGSVILSAAQSVPFDFYTANTVRMAIDSSGNVGIGTSSPSGRLNIATGASATCELRLTSNNTGSGSGDRGRLNFYSADNSGVAYQLGFIDFDRADGTGTASYMAIQTRVAGTVAERARITSDGYLRMASGTGGIQFNGDTAAANALDDYEEGSWTPNVYHSSSNNSTWAIKTGIYRKIGSVVHCWFICDSGNSGTAGSELIIGGLPFTMTTLPNACSLGVWGANNLTPASANIFNGGGTPKIYNGGNSISTQTSYISGYFSYVS